VLAVVAQAPGSIEYQWQHNGVDLSGATNSYLSLSNLGFSDHGFYRVILSSGGFRIASAQATVNVNPTLDIQAHGDYFLLSWPEKANGFALESTSSLDVPFQTVHAPRTTNRVRQTLSMLVPVSNENQFFRLHGQR
jgi:hypothetical protein